MYLERSWLIPNRMIVYHLINSKKQYLATKLKRTRLRSIKQDITNQAKPNTYTSTNRRINTTQIKAKQTIKMNYKINALLLLLIGMLTGNCIAQTDKNTRNLRGWDQEPEFISMAVEWNGGNPGECATANPFSSCGPNATCWRTYRNGNWNGNGICVPNGQCLPRNTWALRMNVPMTKMIRKCCNVRLNCFSGGAFGTWGPFSSDYCICR